MKTTFLYSALIKTEAKHFSLKIHHTDAKMFIISTKCYKTFINLLQTEIANNKCCLKRIYVNLATFYLCCLLHGGSSEIKYMASGSKRLKLYCFCK